MIDEKSLLIKLNMELEKANTRFDEDIDDFYAAVCCALETTIKLVKEQPKIRLVSSDYGEFGVNNWIPCCERLPDKFGTYLVSRKDCIIPELSLYNIKFKQWSRDGVIAWQPLPEPLRI